MEVLAHPLTEPSPLVVAPLAVAFVAVCLVLIAGWFGSVGVGRGGQSEPDGPGHDPPLATRLRAPLGVADTVGRVVGIALLAIAILVGRFGPADELRNLTPALVIGAGWPLLVLVQSLGLRAWERLNPWDGLARPLGPLGADHEHSAAGRAVGLAVLPALVWGWYLHGFRWTLEPDAVATLLLAYSVVTVIGCMVLGRIRWLTEVEVVTVLCDWFARIPGSGLIRWEPPRGAELVLGALAGGLLLGPLRMSTLYGRWNVRPGANWIALGVLLGMAALVVAALWLAERVARRSALPGTAAAAAVPAVASLALAVALSRLRFTTSLQLLPRLASDPLGRGWDLFGTADWGLEPDPLGSVGRVTLQLLVLVAGHAWGARTVRRRLLPSGAADRVEGPDRAARDGVVGVLCALLAAAVLAVSAVPT